MKDIHKLAIALKEKLAPLKFVEIPGENIGSLEFIKFFQWKNWNLHRLIALLKLPLNSDTSVESFRDFLEKLRKIITKRFKANLVRDIGLSIILFDKRKLNPDIAENLDTFVDEAAGKKVVIQTISYLDLSHNEVWAARTWGLYISSTFFFKVFETIWEFAGKEFTGLDEIKTKIKTRATPGWAKVGKICLLLYVIIMFIWFILRYYF